MGIAVSAAALAGMAIYNAYRAKRAEREHPPAGRFVDAGGGVRLHYLERGVGPPVVLLHGNVVTAEDWVLSGVVDGIAGRGRRAIAFDRPGYGYSDRPRGASPCTAADQADLLLDALARLGVERPVVVGHSWGASVAMAMALAEPAAVRGLVLISGYYVPTLRADTLMAAPAAVPVLGGLLRHTVSPLVGAALMPKFIEAMFAPLPVPERFEAGFPRDLALRPSQLRAETQDGALLAYEAASLQARLGELRTPTVVIAGAEDRVVDPDLHSGLLAGRVPHAELRLVPGAGHMVHHAAPELVAEAVEAVSGPAGRPHATAAE